MSDDAFVVIVTRLPQFAQQREGDEAVGMTFYEFRHIKHAFALLLRQGGFSCYEPAASGVQNTRTDRIEVEPFCRRLFSERQAAAVNMEAERPVAVARSVQAQQNARGPGYTVFRGLDSDECNRIFGRRRGVHGDCKGFGRRAVASQRGGCCRP